MIKFKKLLIENTAEENVRNEVIQFLKDFSDTLYLKLDPNTNISDEGFRFIKKNLSPDIADINHSLQRAKTDIDDVIRMLRMKHGDTWKY